jgi:DNA gyrase/topoisomerase IV subunit B
MMLQLERLNDGKQNENGFRLDKIILSDGASSGLHIHNLLVAAFIRERRMFMYQNRNSDYKRG